MVPFSRAVKIVSKPKIVVAGWYGYESVGDTAVLGQMLKEFRTVFPKANFSIVSSSLALTQRTLLDLDELDNVKLIPVGISSGWSLATADRVVVGGGPLDESKMVRWLALRSILNFICGSEQILYCCGIGPVKTLRTRFFIYLMLRFSKKILTRDKTSLTYYPKYLSNRDKCVTFDPGFDFVKNYKVKPDEYSDKKQTLGLFFRLPPAAIMGRDFSDQKVFIDSSFQIIASALNHLRDKSNANFVGLVLQSARPESNDRLVYEYFRSLLDDPDCLKVIPGYQSINYILNELKKVDATLCIRIHGLVFSLARGVPSVAIDYAYPSGPVTAAAEIAAVKRRVIKWQDLSVDGLIEKLEKAISEGKDKKKLEVLKEKEFSEKRINYLMKM